MEDDQKTITAFQAMLENAYEEYRTLKKARRVSDNQFAKWLGVSPVSLNQWINGTRTPNYENAIILSERLGPEVFDVLGYNRPVSVYGKAPDLRFVAEHWSLLDDETRREIFNHVKEVIEGTDGENEQR